MFRRLLGRFGCSIQRGPAARKGPLPKGGRIQRPALSLFLNDVDGFPGTHKQNPIGIAQTSKAALDEKVPDPVISQELAFPADCFRLRPAVMPLLQDHGP